MSQPQTRGENPLTPFVAKLSKEPNQIHIENIVDYDIKLAREGRWLLSGNVTVLKPDEFLSAHFQEPVVDLSTQTNRGALNLLNTVAGDTQPTQPPQAPITSPSTPPLGNDSLPTKYLDAFHNLRRVFSTPKQPKGYL
jgi:hypothetical protein